MPKSPSGKGGNFDTRPNPFTNGAKRSKTRPNLTEVPHLGKALQVCIEAGCAIMVGGTRDGGALVFTILDGEDRHRTYCSNDDEVSDAVQAILNMYEEM